MNPNGPDATGYIAVFQFYGPPYVQGSPLVLHAERRLASDPLDEFFIARDEQRRRPLARPVVPLHRGSWTDIVLRVHVSRSIQRGWIEYVSSTRARSKSVQPGRVRQRRSSRTSRVLLRPDSEAFRTDMQIYRVADRLDRVSLWHTGHKVGRTVSDVDPRSYA